MPQIQTEIHYSFFAALAVLTVIFCVFAFSIFHHVKKKRQQMKSKNYQDENNMEAEKKRIAADLHDDLGSLLNGLKLSFQTLADRDPLFRSSAAQVSDTLLRLREISLNLLPHELEDEGLAAAVESLVERINNINRIKAYFSTDADTTDFDSSKAMLLFRVIQEITTNTIKHSGATNLQIGMTKMGNHLILEIKDDGSGFDYESSLKKKGSSGLKNIQSRLDLFNSILMINSNNHRGTHYFIKIPLRQLTNETS